MGFVKEENMKENLDKANVEPETPQVNLPSLEQLVDRKEHLEKFADVLDRISRQGPVSSNLFEWYGSPGIGKTVLDTAKNRTFRMIPCLRSVRS